MKVFTYGEFIIRNEDYQAPFRIFFKDSTTPYSAMMFGSPEAAAKALSNKLDPRLTELKKVNRFIQKHTFFCKCGCGETFIKRYDSKMEYLKGHKPKSVTNFLKSK